MEGLSNISYKGKQIIYLDYSGFGNDKDRAIQLIKAGTLEYMKYPPKSVIALVKVKDLRFDAEVMNTFKVEQDKAAPFEKRVAFNESLITLFPVPTRMFPSKPLSRNRKPKTG